jgi:hypothetical protein
LWSIEFIQPPYIAPPKAWFSVTTLKKKTANFLTGFSFEFRYSFFSTPHMIPLNTDTKIKKLTQATALSPNFQPNSKEKNAAIKGIK